jgi:hypothetical protein
MNAYEFGQHIAALEKEAGGWDKVFGVGVKAVKGLADDVARGGKQLVNRGTASTRGYARGMRQNTVDPLTIPLKDRYKAVPLTAKPTAPSRLDAAQRGLRGQALSAYHGTPGRLAGGALDTVGGLGQGTMNMMRRGLNKADDLVQGVRGLNPRAAGQRFGDQTVGRTQAAAKHLPEWMGGGTSAMTNARNPLNLAVGTGVGAAGLHYGGKALGVGSEPTPENINAQQMNTQLAQGQHMEVAPNNNSGGLMGMWNSLPIEARYAIGAGVPLALAGAFMGGRGNYGMGGAMGAMGLGAAGLGAAGSGMFGDGPRRMVGQGANALYGMMGGGGGNPMDQINALSQLSPEFGTTMLMGRDPNMNSAQGRQMYDFLTHNRNIIEQLMPQLQGASVNGMKQSSAQAFGEKVARCWKGYEPVPGKKPYSNDSCRPVGSKKKKEKKAVASFAAAPKRPTMTQMPPKPEEEVVPPRDFSNMPPYFSEGQHAAELAEQQNAGPQEADQVAMVKTQAAVLRQLKQKAARSSAPRGTTEMSCTPSARGTSKLVDDKQRPAPTPVPTDATNAQDTGEKAAAPFKKMDLTPPKGKGKAAPAKKKLTEQEEKAAGFFSAGAKALGRAAAGAATGAARGVGSAARTVSRATGAAASELGRSAVNRGAQMARGGAAQMAQGGVGNVLGGGLRAATGAGMYGAGQVARGAGGVARWAGTQVPGSTMMNAARTATAVPIAAGATYGAYRATAPAVDPYLNSAQQFGSDMASRLGQGAQQAGQAAMAVPRAIGQGVHNAGSAIGDAAGTAYGTARNTVVNTANDVRRGVTNAAQTARSYVPNVRNPFYYDTPAQNMTLNPNAQAMLQ